MTDDQTTPEPEGEAVVDAVDASDDRRLDRRTAMKAALGGAAAAAVWSAPRIEGLAVAPDFAAAASCQGGNAGVLNRNSNNCGYYGDTECFGNNCCGTHNFGVNVPGTTPLVAVNGSIGGDVSGDNGFVNLSVNGIDPPFVRCTVSVAGNCNNGTFRTNQNSSNNASSNFVFNNNGNASTLIDCQGGGSFVSSDTDANVRINVACVCL